jgi:hypothetical protein
MEDVITAAQEVGAVAGDIIKVEIEGQIRRIYKNGVLVKATGAEHALLLDRILRYLPGCIGSPSTRIEPCGREGCFQCEVRKVLASPVPPGWQPIESASDETLEQKIERFVLWLKWRAQTVGRGTHQEARHLTEIATTLTEAREQLANVGDLILENTRLLAALTEADPVPPVSPVSGEDQP